MTISLQEACFKDVDFFPRVLRGADNYAHFSSLTLGCHDVCTREGRLAQK